MKTISEELPPVSDPHEIRNPSRKRENLASRFREIRAFSEKLSQPLQIEDYPIQSMPDASPAKWHLAHTSWFFETFVLNPGLPGYREYDPHNAYLFNSYYNAVGPMHCRARRGMISRPTVQETRRYRAQIDAAMQELFERLPEDRWRELVPIIVLGLHHEQQHQELFLTDIKHLFAQNPLYPAYARASDEDATPVAPLDWAGFPEGIYWIGHDGTEFAFDNEGPRHREFLEPFELATRLVTNGEYLAFIEDGGYERPELWLSLGWFMVNDQKWTAPLYWMKLNGGWHEFTLAGLRKLSPAEPVCHLSYFEADAYARWAGARLPTEAEWEVASADALPQGNFAEAGRYHPAPAPSHETHPKQISQMFGEVWEWTRSSYSPYPGYVPAKGALGEYNGKFMCNQYVLRGGSCATSQTHIRRTYRNFFAPDKRWQFMGMRLARDI